MKSGLASHVYSTGTGEGAHVHSTGTGEIEAGGLQV